MYTNVFRFVILLVPFVTCGVCEHPPAVTTSMGTISGRKIEIHPWQLPGVTFSVDAYTRIPYAEAPVGDLRYRYPVKKAWSGELDGTKPSLSCPQIKLRAFTVDMEMSEDCLHLDVFVPHPQPSSAAVMVWIHGGGYHSGAGSIPQQLPVPLAAIGGVIIVTMNYRLATLGFLNTGDGEIPANLGLLDQREALIWVKENIAAFGGDPSRITIFGESAGAASVNLHLISPLSAGLFSGVIMQSGPMLTSSAADSQDSVQKTFKFGRKVGCNVTTSQELVACLRTKSVDDNLNGLYSMMAENERVGMVLTPGVDGYFLPDDPLTLLNEGSLNAEKVLHGVMANEGACITIFIGLAPPDNSSPPPLSGTALKDFIVTLFRTNDSVLLDTVAYVYTHSSQIDGTKSDFFQSLSDIIADTVFVCQANILSDVLAKAGKSVYLYVMTHVPSRSALGDYTWTGATHVEDIPYVFGSPFLLPEGAGPSGMSGFFADYEVPLSLQIMRYWSNFAKTGNPNLSSKEDSKELPQVFSEWPKFTTSEPVYKEFSRGFPNRNGPFHSKECFFWRSIFPTLVENAVEMMQLKAVLAEHVAADSSRSCTEGSCPEN